MYRGHETEGMVGAQTTGSRMAPFQWWACSRDWSQQPSVTFFSCTSPCKLKTGSVKIQVDDCISLYIWNKLDLVVQITGTMRSSFPVSACWFVSRADLENLSLSFPWLPGPPIHRLWQRGGWVNKEGIWVTLGLSPVGASDFCVSTLDGIK